MKKTAIAICAVILAAAFIAACSGDKKPAASSSDQSTTAADSSAKKPQTECPVMGGKIDKKFYADYQGKRIYFCCAGCPEEFMKDPEKYMNKLDEMGEEPEDVPGNP